MNFILPYKERRRLHGRAYHAQQKNHLEVCGVLSIGPDEKIELHFLRNYFNGPRHFQLSNSDIKKIGRELKMKGKKIAGIFHSHPVSEAIPGPGDLKGGFYKGIAMIYDVCGREIKLWRSVKKGKSRVAKEIPLILEKPKRTK